MSITIPKPLIPILVKPVVPAWVLIAVISAQIAVNVIVENPEPQCTLVVHYPHYSRSMERDRGLDVIKVNITSKCNVPQDYTEISASIKSKVNGLLSIHKFDRTREPADSEDATTAYFKNLFKFCIKGVGAEYLGEASGIVHLKSGVNIAVSDKNQNYFPQNCRITAK